MVKHTKGIRANEEEEVISMKFTDKRDGSVTTIS
jgi:hypothetical protein